MNSSILWILDSLSFPNPHTCIHILSHEAQFSVIKNPFENNDHKGATEQNKMTLAIDTQFFSLEMHNTKFLRR